MMFHDEHLKLIGKLIYENIPFEVDSYGLIPMDRIVINGTCCVISVYYYNSNGAEGYFEIDHFSSKGRTNLIRKTADDTITLLSRLLSPLTKT